MPVCERCRFDSPPGRDFCGECGYYLRWEHTELHQAEPARAGTAVQPRTAPPPAQQERPRDARGGVELAVGLPGEPIGADVVCVQVAAGEEVQVVAHVRNRGELVDHFDISVAGMPEDWWTAEPACVALNPFHAAGGYEQQVVIRLYPPRSPEARAGEWRLEILATPRGARSGPACAPVALTILPFWACETKLAPEVASGRRSARFTCTVENQGNATAEVAVAAEDGEGECRTACEPPALTLDAGETAAARVVVRPRRQIWLGRRRERAVNVTATATGSPTPTTRRAVFRQRPWLPWWLALVVPPLVVAALLLLLLWPKTAVVPDLRGVPSTFAAQQQLQEAGLTLDPTVRGERSKEPPGSVIGQTVPPGEELDRGDSVGIQVALGSKRHEVPNVVGKTLQEADAALAKRFRLGKWQPDDAAPEAVIRAQWPAAGERRRAGTPVNVSLKAGTAPAPAVVPGGPGTHEPKPKPKPEPGALPAQTLAFDNGHDLLSAAPGEQARPLSADGAATEPAWHPDGDRIAYMRWVDERGQIWVFSPGDGDYPGRQLSDDQGDDHRPAWSPDGSAVAFVDRSDGSICVASAADDFDRAACRTDPRWAHLQVAWTPDGSLLSVARGQELGAGDGVVRFAFPGGGVEPAAAWAEADARLELAMGDLVHLAVAPDGAQVAVTAGPLNEPGAVYRIAVEGGTLAPRPEPLDGVKACDVAWTADGRLTVSQAPCGGETGQIEVIEADGARAEVGAGSSPAWQPEPGEPDA